MNPPFCTELLLKHFAESYIQFEWMKAKQKMPVGSSGQLKSFFPSFAGVAKKKKKKRMGEAQRALYNVPQPNELNADM